MAVFYNSSAVINTANFSTATVGNLNATQAVITGTVSSAISAAIIISENANSSVLASRLVFTTSPTATFGISTDAGVATITASNQGGGPLTVSAGTTSSNISSLVFSNANSVTFGFAGAANAGTITASNQLRFQRYYGHPQLAYSNATFSEIYAGNTTNSTVTNYIQPINLPYPVSAAFIRMPITQGITIGATGLSDGSGAYTQNQTIYFNIYTLGTGVSSTALILKTALSTGSTFAWSISCATVNSNQTHGHTFTFPIEGATSVWQTSYTTNSTNINIATTHLTAFTGNRYLDIPTAALTANYLTLDEGPYWIAVARSSSRTGSSNSFTRHQITFQNFVFTQYASGFSPMNIASTYLKLGYGQWTTNTQGATSSAIALSDIRTAASNIEIPFEIGTEFLVLA